jgi:hypothetical protein
MICFYCSILLALIASINTEPPFQLARSKFNTNEGNGLLPVDGHLSDAASLLQTLSAANKRSSASHVHGIKRGVPINVGSRPQSPIRATSGAFMERSAVTHVEPKTNAREHSLRPHVNPTTDWRKDDLTKCDATGCWSIDTTDEETMRTLHALKFEPLQVPALHSDGNIPNAHLADLQFRVCT